MQTFEYVYEIRSRLKFDKRGEMNQVTLYGSDTPLNKSELLARARMNINKKFKKSSGKILGLEIAAIYY